MARRKKNLRRANGSGTISCSNRKDLRKRWLVRVTTGYKRDSSGKVNQTRKLLGYFETQLAAETALANYMNSMGIFEDAKSNVMAIIEDIWNDFVEEQLGKEYSESRKKSFGYTWKYVPESIRKAPFGTINYKDIADLFEDLRDNKKLGYSTLKRIRTDLGMLFKYAKKRGIRVDNYPAEFKLGKSPKKGETLVFNHNEIKKLWKMYENREGNDKFQFTVKVILMLMYNGCRINEFLGVKTKDVFIGDRYFIIPDAKTTAGIRRIPIHRSMVPIYEELYDKSNEYFLTNPVTNKKYTYANFRDSYWDRLRSEMGWNEDLTPHNCRKTFASYIKYYKLDYTCQKLIFGHEGQLDLMSKVYTLVPTKTLVEEIDKVPAPDALDDLMDAIIMES